jgi:hypothetical protein
MNSPTQLVPLVQSCRKINTWSYDTRLRYQDTTFQRPLLATSTLTSLLSPLFDARNNFWLNTKIPCPFWILALSASDSPLNLKCPPNSYTLRMLHRHYTLFRVDNGHMGMCIFRYTVVWHMGMWTCKMYLLVGTAVRVCWYGLWKAQERSEWRANTRHALRAGKKNAAREDAVCYRSILWIVSTNNRQR